jgi:chromosome partitioning protein
MKTLAVLSRKGGAGKTTVAPHLTVTAQAGGCRVALVDMD